MSLSKEKKWGQVLKGIRAEVQGQHLKGECWSYRKGELTSSDVGASADLEDSGEPRGSGLALPKTPVHPTLQDPFPFMLSRHAWKSRQRPSCPLCSVGVSACVASVRGCTLTSAAFPGGNSLHLSGFSFGSTPTALCHK